jgi:Phage integrase family
MALTEVVGGWALSCTREETCQGWPGRWQHHAGVFGALFRIYLHTLYQSNIRRQFKLALHLILLTLVRKSEMLLAGWKDVNLETGEWQIPAEHSKTGQPHLVYISTQATALFRELKALAGESVWVMPGRTSLAKPFARNAMNQAMGSITFAIAPFTIHDLRRTGATQLSEKGFPSDVVEKALNHTVGGVRGVYNRAEYADQRRKMRFSRSCNQAAEVPSSKVTDRLPRSPWMNSRIVPAFVSRMDSMISLPLPSMMATEIVAW